MPVPEPSILLDPAIVGLKVVPQHTPRELIVPPPSYVTFPPLIAVVAFTPVIIVVVTDGIDTEVVTNDKSDP